MSIPEAQALGVAGGIFVCVLYAIWRYMQTGAFKRWDKQNKAWKPGRGPE